MTDYHKFMIPADLDIDMLRCFVEVARTKSFTQAGLNIHLTQSGVSVKIRRLEDRLSTKVFKRSTKSLTLTEDGERLLNYAERILSVHDEALNQFTTTSKIRSHLKVGIIEYILPELLPGVLEKLGKQHSDISVEVETGIGLHLLPMFERGELDLLVAGKDKELKNGIDSTLFEEKLLWVVSEEGELSFDDVIPLVAFPQQCTFRKHATEHLTRLGLAWEIVFTGTSITSIQAAIKAGMGLSILPEGAVNEGIILAPPDLNLPELPTFPITIFLSDEKKSDAAEIFIGYLENEIAHLY